MKYLFSIESPHTKTCICDTHKSISFQLLFFLFMKFGKEPKTFNMFNNSNCHWNLQKGIGSSLKCMVGISFLSAP